MNVHEIVAQAQPRDERYVLCGCLWSAHEVGFVCEVLQQRAIPWNATYGGDLLPKSIEGYEAIRARAVTQDAARIVDLEAENARLRAEVATQKSENAQLHAVLSALQVSWPAADHTEDLSLQEIKDDLRAGLGSVAERYQDAKTPDVPCEGFWIRPDWAVVVFGEASGSPSVESQFPFRALRGGDGIPR